MSLHAATLYLLRYSEGEILLFAVGSEKQTTTTMTNMGLPQSCDSRFAYDLSDATPINALNPGPAFVNVKKASRLVLAIKLVSFDGKPACKAHSSIERTISNLGPDLMASSAGDWTMKVIKRFRSMGLFNYSDSSLSNALSRANAEYNTSGEIVRRDIGSPYFQ